MLFLSALGYAVGIVSGLIGFYLFLESRTHPRARQRAMVFGVAAMVILVVTYLVANQQSSLRASEPGITPAPTSPGPGVTPVQTTPYPSPTPTPVPKSAPGTVLYQADQSWSVWSGSKDWHIVNGMLVNDGTALAGGPTIVAPYELGNVADYAVETNIQVVNWKSCCTSQFAIVVRAVFSNEYWQGYSLGDDLQGPNIESSTSAGDFGSSLASAPFAPGNAYHTYRIEVKGNRIRLFIDGGIKLDVNDNTYSSGGRVGFWSFGAQLNISSFKIIAL